MVDIDLRHYTCLCFLPYLVYDVTKRVTFEALENWLVEVQTYSTNPDAVTLLVGNKIDKENREISREEGAKFAKQHSMIFIECSAKTKLGVQQAFEELVQKVSNNSSLPYTSADIGTTKIEKRRGRKKEINTQRQSE
jgi:Ras-related protein Rab-18